MSFIGNLLILPIKFILLFLILIIFALNIVFSVFALLSKFVLGIINVLIVLVIIVGIFSGAPLLAFSAIFFLVFGLIGMLIDSVPRFLRSLNYRMIQLFRFKF